jgi:hypothetical protein
VNLRTPYRFDNRDPDNKFDLGKIERGEGKQAKIRPWVELLTKGEPQPTILPCWRSESVDWYAIAFSERQLRRLSEELMAFVGPTYSTFRGQRAQLNPQEQAVAEFDELLSKVGSTAESILHDALPYLLGFFQKDEQFPRGEFESLYYSLLELLVLSTEAGDVNLVLFNDLAIAKRK